MNIIIYTHIIVYKSCLLSVAVASERMCTFLQPGFILECAPKRAASCLIFQSLWQYNIVHLQEDATPIINLIYIFSRILLNLDAPHPQSRSTHHFRLRLVIWLVGVVDEKESTRLCMRRISQGSRRRTAARLHGYFLFAWVLLFRKHVVTAPMGTNIYGLLLIIDG